MPKSNLDPHADLILDLLAKKATNEKILEILLAKPVPTSLEGRAVMDQKECRPEAAEGAWQRQKAKSRACQVLLRPGPPRPHDHPSCPGGRHESLFGITLVST